MRGLAWHMGCCGSSSPVRFKDFLGSFSQTACLHSQGWCLCVFGWGRGAVSCLNGPWVIEAPRRGSLRGVPERFHDCGAHKRLSVSYLTIPSRHAGVLGCIKPCIIMWNSYIKLLSCSLHAIASQLMSSQVHCDGWHGDVDIEVVYLNKNNLM